MKQTLEWGAMQPYQIRTDKPYRIFAEELERTAFEQFKEAMLLDTTVQGALMPDAHTGYTLPVGAVIASKDWLYPSYVGYDIGCGMSAIPTTFRLSEVRTKADEIFGAIYRTVPVGFSNNATPTRTLLDPAVLTDGARAAFEKRGAFYALGSLGGGNHFIEIGHDESDRVWIIVHSGSRGVGHGIGTHYMRLAAPDNKCREGHYGFEASSDNGKGYINDIAWVLQFALENRREIVRRVVAVMGECCTGSADWDKLINRNHNHVEERDGFWIHRKGATHAEEGMMGVIPGNMRDGSFIVQGKGNPESLFSSSHGAGRVLGRKQAKRELDIGEFTSSMDGIKARVEQATIDESPAAYKDIFHVMEQQRELVEVCQYVRPLINIKG